MHLRRALLLFALVLGLTALAASVAPPPRTETEPAPAPAPPPPPDSAGAAGPTTLSFHAPPKGEKPPEREAAPDDHVIVKVNAESPGQVTIPDLGRTATVTESVPAQFNILAPEPGTYEVMFEGVGEEPTRVGAIVTRR